MLTMSPAIGSDPTDKKKLEPKVIQQKVYGCWIEVNGINAGEKVPLGDLCGRQYGPNNSSTWLVVGQSDRAISKGGIHIDTTKSPMWMDSYHIEPDGTRYTVPRIFKLEGDTLTVAFPDPTTMPLKVRKSGKYPERPKDFTSTKVNGYSVRVMKPTTLYGQNPIENTKPKH